MDLARRSAVSRARRTGLDRSTSGRNPYIVARAAQFDSRVVTLGQLVFFSTATGDAWMLDPEDGLALKLADAGNRNPAKIVETASRYAIEWTASYRLDGEAFVTMDGSGQRVILGYPVEEVALAQQRIRR
jgi:hypothetical protein